MTDNGASLGTGPAYSICGIRENHTVLATFTIPTYTVIASAGTNGTISPSGNVSVPEGNDQKISIIPSGGYRAASLTVDGSAQTPIPSEYTFTNVKANHAISGTFDLPAVLTVVAPNSGEVIPAAGTFTIRWGKPASLNPAKYALSYTCDGTKYVSITGAATGFSYVWTVPKPDANKTACKVKVKIYNVVKSTLTLLGTDTSNANFSITP